MNNKIIWLLVVIVLLIGSAFVYSISTEEVRASIIFFGSIIVVCLIAGLLIASGLKYFLANR